MWFWLSLIALICWSGSDLFSKIGCRGQNDKLSHLKMVTAVGVVMGLHAAYEIFIGGVEVNLSVLLTYLPVSLLYIGSMMLGYVGLRYIELSVSSPVCNCSGAVVALVCIFMGRIGDYNTPMLIAVALMCLGVIGLGFVESREDVELRALRQKDENNKYTKSVLALVFPLLYCVLDAAGTFADSVVLETLDEAQANVAYELTFLAAGIVCFIYTFFIKKSRYVVKLEGAKFVGAAFETAGQFAYIFALADTDHVAFAAPIISSYCVVSALWAAIFLKERLSWKHYICLAATLIGIVVMGIYDI